MYEGLITDVKGITVGHATDRAARTGVTAIVPEEAAVAGVDVRGGAPGTRETDALEAGRLVNTADAILLTGGSAYGLDSASGAMKLLERQQRGFVTAYARVPIVAAAALYDLGNGRSDIRPDADMGMLAVMSASKSFKQGRVGAGCGALCGKLTPGAIPDAGGLGSASITLPGGAVVGAIVAVNAAGDVYDPYSGAFLAGARGEDGAPRPALAAFADSAAINNYLGNTTIGAIATDAKLTREQANRLALIAHDGFARTIRPVHTPADGDTIFALATGHHEVEFMLVCAVAAEVMARAVANAVTAREDNL